MRFEWVIALLVSTVLFLPLMSTPAIAEVSEPCNGVETKIVVRENPSFNDKLEYRFQFSERENRYCVTVHNRGEGKDLSSFTATVDGVSAAPKMPILKSDESITVVRNITGYLDPRRDNHVVVLGTGGDETKYNFTQRSTPENSTIPSPYISNVEVVRYESNDSTALRVDTFNPSKRGYAFSVQVETFGTDGDYEVAAPQENETQTVVIPLKESTDDVVAGKVRIFEQFGKPETKFDQKEFMAEPGAETNYWDDEFERVPGTVDNYSYSNETARVKYQGYDEDLLSPVAKIAGAVGTMLLLTLGFWWRRHRKHR